MSADYTDEDLRHCACDEHGECGGDTARCCFRWHTNINAKSAAVRAEARRERDAEVAELHRGIDRGEEVVTLTAYETDIADARQSEREACERIVAGIEHNHSVRTGGQDEAGRLLRDVLRRLRERAK